MASTLTLSDIPSNENLSMQAAPIVLRLFQPQDAEAFRALNEAWIRKHFGLEEHDREMLGDPEGYILRRGGQIIMAVAGDTAVGCCALIPIGPGVLEVAKMAVAEEYQGRGLGRRVLARTIEEGRAMGATKLYLETNSKLANAIHLYESLGFRHLPSKQSPYVRANVFMELPLTEPTTDSHG
ncbi:GNAT family N-acetyltransferase [Edaphobacter bradus]|uniref:GNAT family N-acetyltransferase n=1 Tax=Edaphobacter bradus TaxID=2259016 RepID=UPI0021E05984|nr:GNAT family N-acetyltransferase [Edaphobacter bradus]